MTSGTTLEKTEIEKLYFGLALEAQKQISFSLKHPKKKAIVIAGPTGVGKSALALMLAEAVHGEIISADSMQVYRGMDIGTSKPTKEEQKKVPHHLIDICDIHESFNVVDFYYEARHCCQCILTQEEVPIIVGGSGFYIHALLYGPPGGPPSVPEVRKSLEKELAEKGSANLYERLRQYDPQYAATITKHDKQKIVRALEIISVTGQKVSKLPWTNRVKPLNYDFHCWVLNRPRDQLYRRIEKRCEKMLTEGFLDEVKRLKEQGICENTSAANAIGYRQALDYLGTKQTEEDYLHFVDEFKKASRNYAKRQLTWFKKEPLFRWLDLDMHDYEVAVDIMRQDFLAR